MLKYEKLIADYKKRQLQIKENIKNNYGKKCERKALSHSLFGQYPEQAQDMHGSTCEKNEQEEQEELLLFLDETEELFDLFLQEMEQSKTQQKITHENMLKMFDKMGVIIILQNPENGGAIYTNKATQKIFVKGIEKEKKRFQLLLIELLDIGRGVSAKKQYFDEVNNNWYSVDTVEIDWERDEIIYFHTLTDITSMKQVEEQLMNEANLDRMTGVYNRSGGKHEIYKFRETLKEKEHACLCMIDLDGLKKINDNYGHHAGDIAIITFANIIKESINDTDLIVRMGGDEFIIIFRKSKVDAVQVINTIQEKINDYNVNSKQPYRIKFSYGLCEFTNRDRVLSEIISKADVVMYKEKKRKKAHKN